MREFNEDLLHEYLDGTLDDKTRQAVEAHLASSPAARAQLAELEALFGSLDALPELPVTRDLSAAVVAEIGRETAVTTPLPRWLWALLLGQVMIALLLAGNVWALLLDWLGNGRQLAVSWINSVQLPTLTFLNEFWMEVAAVWQQPNLPNLTIDLPTSQWALLFGLALLVWLAGNRLLFTEY
jgi:anti-sigma factor RsiW